MKPNKISYPLAPSGERYKRIARLVNPLLSSNCAEMFEANEKRFRADAVPIEVTPEATRLLLYSHDRKNYDTLGIEVEGDVFAEDAAEHIKWFSLHGDNMRRAYHEGHLQAAWDNDASLPPAFQGLFDSIHETPACMCWQAFRYTLSLVEALFKQEELPSDCWTYSQGHYIFLEEEDVSLCVMICNNEDTGKHLGFVHLLNAHDETILLAPYIFQRGAFALFTSIQDAMKVPQDVVVPEKHESTCLAALQSCYESYCVIRD